ncbi:MAG: hypothetical protein KJ621_12875 [Proteobacteria bacterium]|nr:hypothetical protein [Pseudomonadota bacterium]
MRNIHKLAALTVTLLFALGSVALVGCGGSSSADTPQATIKSLFKAAAKGDAEGMKKFLTGTALTGLPKPDSPSFKMVKAFGSAYEGVEGVKISGNQATAMVKLSADAITKMIVAEAMKQSKPMLDKIKDPKAKAMAMDKMKAQAKAVAMKMTKMPVSLVKKDGKWLVTKMTK